MSQENVDLAGRAYDAFNRRDLDAFLALMDDAVDAVPRTVAIEGGYRGHDGVRRWWNNLLDTFPDFTIEVVELRDLGELTLAAVRLRGRGAGSAAPLDEAVWQLIQSQGGKCIWWRTFNSEAEALEAAGLRE